MKIEELAMPLYLKGMIVMPYHTCSTWAHSDVHTRMYIHAGIRIKAHLTVSCPSLLGPIPHARNDVKYASLQGIVCLLQPCLKLMMLCCWSLPPYAFVIINHAVHHDFGMHQNRV